MKPGVVGTIFILLALSATSALRLSAQAGPGLTEAVLRARYETAVLTLRHPLQQPSQEYDAEGNPPAGGLEGAASEYGVVLIDHLSLEQGRLFLEGRRITFPAGGKKKNPIPVPGEPVRITLSFRNPPSLDQARDALGRVFRLKRDGNPEGPAPPRWLCERPAPACEPVYRVGKDVTSPMARFAPEPDMSVQARKAKYQGTVVVGLLIDKVGRARQIAIVRSLGMGLDEQAVSKISTWKFKPAELNGQPVAVAMAVEVSFHLF